MPYFKIKSPYQIKNSMEKLLNYKSFRTFKCVFILQWKMYITYFYNDKAIFIVKKV